MVVLIDRALFKDPIARGLPFLEVFALARAGRHRILTAPTYDPGGQDALNDWLSEQSSEVAEDVRLILTSSIQAISSLPAATNKVRLVAATVSDWQAAQLTIEDALRLLRCPLGLLLENRRSDFQFLLRLTPPTQREALRRALEEGWIEVLHGCGLEEMMAMINELVGSVNASVMSRVRLSRLWVMFDRDSDPADRTKPSPQSERFRSKCAQVGNPCSWPLTFHQLGRRSIENYLPEKLLRVWQAEAAGPEKTRRREKVDALCQLKKDNPRAAWQYNMKGGLIKDLSGETRKELRDQGRAIRDADLDSAFRGMGEAQRRALTNGFGGRIADLFTKDPSGCEEWFKAEYERQRLGAHPTRAAMLSSLFARI